jgi:glucosamine-6-phosphate isomerase
MQLKVVKDYEALSSAAADQILKEVQNKPGAVLCLASGDTPKRTYTLVAERAKAGQVDFSGCTFIGLDEWVGISPDNEGSCHFFLNTYLFRPLGIQSTNFHLFDGLSKDPASECRRIDMVIRKKGGIDLILVGVGMNGHVGFNEPGIPVNLYSHVAELDPVTQSVGQKYFKQSTKLGQGLTIGLKHFTESRKALMLASGRKKAEVIKQALEGPVTPEMPASLINSHRQGLLLVDEEAASLLTQN